MQWKRHAPELKTKVPLKGNKTINEIASEMGVHTPRITQWKKQFNPKRVRRLLRSMGLEAIYPKPNLS